VWRCQRRKYYSPRRISSTRARSTAAYVKALADALSVEAGNLKGEVRRFLADVQAA